MKTKLTFLALLACFLMHAQYHDGTVFLKDSTELKGLIKVRPLGGIKFKSNRDDKPTAYDYNHITGFHTKGENYIYIKTSIDFPPRIVKEHITGKITLYSTEIYNPGHTIPAGYAGGGMTMGGGSATIYFLMVENKITRLGPKLKKKHFLFFKSCPILIDKINSKEIHRREVYDIVDFYNKKCPS
ncbi:hypothetical protein [uncultured Maribacter sp.]|uniref:hypothetical protein n=1 Tax=uncultured Maribacter sp. TaxID=431308 RepID=UPI00262B0A6E|nr:hypothetical protein [uncultured Maribacter sp.]